VVACAPSLLPLHIGSENSATRVRERLGSARISVLQAGAPPCPARSNRTRHMIERFRRRARHLKRETHALYLAVLDPRTPWYAKVIAAAVVAYALSPFDLIPDFVPVLGYLDDLIIVPLGITLALKLVPDQELLECRQRAQAAAARPISESAPPS
jgi:uncharacterized membrane protein YkvA (DUF1232 family)